jgi:hypothetical protein
VLTPHETDDPRPLLQLNFFSSSGWHWTELRAKALPDFVSVSTMTAFSGVANLLGGVVGLLSAVF